MNFKTMMVAGALLFLLTAGAQAKAIPQGEPQLEMGKPFPALVLPTVDEGQPASLAKFRGKKVVLHIFASW